MRRIVLVLAAAGTLILGAAPAALAHGEEQVHDLTFVVGFAVEPAYAGQPNAVQIEIAHAGQPVTDIASGEVTVDVSFGDQQTTLALEPAFEVGEFGTPGDYRAAFIPSQPGPYTFHVKGTIEGEAVDFTMRSGPKTFSEVENPADATFPAVDAPSTTDLAARADQEAARTDAAIASANDAATTARTLAIVALAVAGVAIVVAIVARRGGRQAGGS